MNQILRDIAEQEHLNFNHTERLTGGDINDVFKLNTAQGDFAVKINDAQKFPHMFQREAEALQLIKSTQSFEVPEVINFESIGNNAYLLLEFLPTGTMQENFWEDFGEKLAKMHRFSAETFGLKHDNYIAELPQYNQSEHTDAAAFYIEYRLEPQFKIAAEKGFSFPKTDRFFKNISQEIPLEVPALIHGDLWGGNYMAGPEGRPVLIDPALAYAPREMDLAMMKMFGGFPDRVFDHYHEHFALKDNWRQRLDIWQLYYLLVHLNLFGSTYFTSVNSIYKTYS